MAISLGICPTFSDKPIYGEVFGGIPLESSDPAQHFLQGEDILVAVERTRKIEVSAFENQFPPSVLFVELVKGRLSSKSIPFSPNHFHIRT